LVPEAIWKTGVKPMEKALIRQYLANIMFLFKSQKRSHPNEQPVFQEICRRLRASEDDLQAAAALCADEAFAVRPVGSDSDRLANLRDFVAVAWADGVFMNLEKHTIRRFAKELGVTQAEMNKMVAEAKRQQKDGKKESEGKRQGTGLPAVGEEPRIGINYAHVLRELSVNSQRPCEVIRELISNAYDARATEIRYYPLVQQGLTGFIFFDNGEGMSHEDRPSGISPYEAFFSIGYSTKTLDEHIGYKGQGSKLCFACGRFLLITRCAGESAWRYKEVDNPRERLNVGADIVPQVTSAPWELLHGMVGTNPSKSTSNVLHSLDETFFKEQFVTGSMLVVLKFDVGKKFSKFFGTKNGTETKVDKSRKHETSYLWNYIRFYTRHGDVRILNAETTGFSVKHITHVEGPIRKSMEPAKLMVWVDERVGPEKERFGDQLKEVPAGFPYLRKHTGEAPLDPKYVSQLRSGRFYARHAGTFEYEGRPFSWILVVDGNRRALDEYDTLGRERSRRSGIPLSDQRGSYLCSHGMKICEFKDLFSLVGGDYEILAEPKAFRHYLFLLNGPFELVTDRNSIKQSDEALLSDSDFHTRIKKALDGIRNGGTDMRDGVDHNGVFRSLLDRLTNDVQLLALEKELAKINRVKKDLCRRPQFTIKTGPLAGKPFVYPDAGEENWVGVLYTLLAHFVSAEEKYAASVYRDLWVRPINMSGVSIDALALPLVMQGIPEAAVGGLEYKLTFSHKDTFNHPLLAVQQIACWEFSTPPVDKARVEDDFDYMGFVHLNEKYDSRVAYEITKIQRSDRTDLVIGAKIKVVSLKELIRETFDCEME
jgi:hypothetical protein